MKDHRVLSPREETEAEEELFRALLGLRTIEELRAFFLDLCTPAELQAMKDRWNVVELLDVARCDGGCAESVGCRKAAAVGNALHDGARFLRRPFEGEAWSTGADSTAAGTRNRAPCHLR